MLEFRERSLQTADDRKMPRDDSAIRASPEVHLHAAADSYTRAQVRIIQLRIVTGGMISSRLVAYGKGDCVSFGAIRQLVSKRWENNSEWPQTL